MNDWAARPAPRSISTGAPAGSTPPTPACTRSSRWAWSCRGPPTTWSAAVRIAAEEGVPILPRGAATSLSGQTVGPAIVLDFSKYLNRIGVVDRDRMTVRVEPGVVLDRLNAHLKPLGPDVRARRLDQRPRHDRRDDRQQLGRGAVAAVRQDGRSRPRRRRRAGRRHARDASARSPTTSSTPSAPGPTASARSTATVRDTVARHRDGDRGAVPADPPAGQRLQPRRVHPRPAGPARRLARRALAVQPGAADRRLGGDAGGRHRRPS